MVYLIHFDRPYRHAQHYIGYSSSGTYGSGMLQRRMAAHANGTGARLMQVVTEAGIGWAVARIWPGADRYFERRLKRRGSAKRICPVCKGQAHKVRKPWRFRSPGRYDHWT